MCLLQLVADFKSRIRYDKHMFRRLIAMDACTTQCYCNISCSITKHVYETRVFVKRESCLHCISNQSKLFSLYSQAVAWLYGRTPASHANCPSSILIRTTKFYYLLYLCLSRLFSHTQDDFSLTTNVAHAYSDRKVSVKCVFQCFYVKTSLTL